MSLRQLMVAKDISEALQVKAFLESRGISVSVPDAHFNTIVHYVQGSRVLIEDNDYETAIKALREINLSTVKGFTPKTEEEGVKKLNRALGASLLGILGIPFIPNFYSLYLLFKFPRVYNTKFLLTLLMNMGAISIWIFGIIEYAYK
ncbi:MAG: hypothetical protein KDD37_00655 [Bdellovibrionales bacterium]|nr:hypothetical protein [Bdellovibrionales bacterium]